ncbi:SGNH/GDSL hydrolase family protein [Streptomyces sp. NPDC026672]|uniref:SGNH/GDSL hydrolase family protein n=1 Tax=unclassified Streptomyces TaxID=2593676 RepID=UPI0033E2EDEC
MGSQYHRIAALGSSFAAGPGIEPVADRAAGRSARNYPHLLADRLGARLTDLTVSGATTSTLLDTPQRRGGTRFPPQVHGIPADTDLVTVTVGGNDLNYIGRLFTHAVAARLATRAWTRPLRAVLPGPQVPTPSAADVEHVATGLADVVAAVRERAPGVRVLLVDYLTVLGPDTLPGPEAPFAPDVLDGLRRLGDRVEDVFAEAAARSGAELVRIGERSRAHALGSAQPWVTGLPGRLRDLRTVVPFHPNADGMRATAEAVADHLTTSPTGPDDHQPAR